MVDRTERQTESLKKWISVGCRGSVIAATGFGKTRIALRAIKWFLKNNPDKTILIVVPSEYLKLQWINLLVEWELVNSCQVWIINSVIKRKFVCDFLVIDEIHVTGAESFMNVFRFVTYKIALGLTGTIDRLDGKESVIKKFLPICDEVTLNECIANKWLALFREYKVLIDVDLTEYQDYTQKFIGHFSFFNFDFNLAMSMLNPQKGIVNRRIYAKTNGMDYKIVDAHAFGFSNCMQKRKSFILNHPKKLEIAELILENRKDSKAITFSQSKEMANSISVGETVHSGLGKKKRKEIEARFDSMTSGVLNSVKTIDLGADIQLVNLGIILCGTSSSIQKMQRTGRTIRLEGDKISEIFNLILRGTVEEEWFRKASKDISVITIDEKELLTVLKNEELEEKQHKENQYLFRW